MSLLYDIVVDVPAAPDQLYGILVPQISGLVAALCPPETDTYIALAKLLCTFARKHNVTSSLQYLNMVMDEQLRITKLVDMAVFMSSSAAEAFDLLKEACDEVAVLGGADPPQVTPVRPRTNPSPQATPPSSASAADIGVTVQAVMHALLPTFINALSGRFSQPNVSSIRSVTSGSLDTSMTAMARHLYPISSSCGDNVCPFLEKTGAPSLLETYGAPTYYWKSDAAHAPKLRAILTKMATLLLQVNSSPSVSMWKQLEEKRIKLPTVEWNLVNYAPPWVAAELVAAHLVGDMESYSILTCARMPELDPTLLEEFATGRTPVPSASCFGGYKKPAKK